jgi:hypothetical protein
MEGEDHTPFGPASHESVPALVFALVLTENLSLFNGFDMLGSASGGFAVAEGNYAVTGQGTVLISEHGDSLH